MSDTLQVSDIFYTLSSNLYFSKIKIIIVNFTIIHEYREMRFTKNSLGKIKMPQIKMVSDTLRVCRHHFANLVSRILFLNYHLSAPVITDGMLLPTLALERAALKRAYTWHYSTQGLPLLYITAKHRELLPHVFTFFPTCAGIVIFCGTCCISARSRNPSC